MNLSGQRVYLMVMSQPSRLNPVHNIRTVVGVYQESTLDEAKSCVRDLIRKMKDNFGEVYSERDNLDTENPQYLVRYTNLSHFEIVIEQTYIQ